MSLPEREPLAHVTSEPGSFAEGWQPATWPADELDTGLSIARRQRGWTFITLPAPIVRAPALVAAFPAAPIVAWSSRQLTLVGIGVAIELRSSGADRWNKLITAAHHIERGTTVDTSASSGDEGWRTLTRPRLMGGLAFAPGAASAAPWIGFGDAWFALPRWTYVHDGSRAALLLAVNAKDARLAARWSDELSRLRIALASRYSPRAQPPLRSLDHGDRAAWRAQVRTITSEIGQGACAKIVAARRAVVTLAADARPADMLAELDTRHADCVRILVRPPGGGALIAATPERLVRVDGATVRCDALAGSRARGDETGAEHASGAAGAALLASAKDRREHDLVVCAITVALRDLGATLDEPGEPGLRALRHVIHLHTPIAATLRRPRHVLELAAALHPTPAVGGTPTQVATDWIAACEQAPRGWYASPVGWFDLEGNGELAVAIRSGLLAGDQAHLWAGAGIVAGSDPDHELAETDLKLRAMLGALGVTP